MPDIRAQIEAKVAGAVAAHAMWSPGVVLVAAVSGGADSLCLLGTLLALRDCAHPLAPGRIVVAHLDHGLRGEAGAEDARWVAAFAAALGLECVVARTDVRALARAAHRSLEDAARRARYDFLRKVARDTGAARICTGHTRDDQAETLVMHWLRGSGLAGLAGMAPLSGDIARPLLDLARAGTVAYCAARGWQPREDLTNADLTYLRNRVRHELLPILEHYNPGLRDTLVRNANLLAADERYLETQTSAAWSEAAIRDETGIVVLSLSALSQLPLALRRRVLRRMVQRLAGDGHSLAARHLFAIERLLVRGTSGDALDLPPGLRVRREYTTLVCERPLAPTVAPLARGSTPAPPRPLPIPGSVELPALGWRVSARLLPSPLDHPAAHAPMPALVDPATGASLPNPRAYLDADLAGASLSVRTWQPGDRLQPLGMKREKKLQDLFTDAKIPRSLRTRLPLVAGARHLLWVAGLRMDERVRVTDATRRVLALELEPLLH